MEIPEMVWGISQSKPLEKVMLNGRLALHYNGVHFYYPEDAEWITIKSKDQANTISANSDINNKEFIITEKLSSYKCLPEKDYQKKYGKFDEKLGVYIGVSKY